MSNLSPRIDSIEKAVYGNEIEVSKIDAPHTTVVNEQGQPRQIFDLANNMKTSMGVERIMFNALSLLDKEFGPNGETVYEVVSKDSRVRFIGGLWGSISNTSGTKVVKNPGAGTTTTFEITYYGTGLNILIPLGGSGFNIDEQTDGGAVNTILSGYNGSAVISGRNYTLNSPLNITSGLSLGIHTTKIILDAGTFTFDGCEILTESSQLVINPGKPRLDSRESISQVLTDYNTGFDLSSDTLGTKGGRVLVYQAIDGTIAKRLVATDVAQANLGATDHSNEEIYRRINGREFGAQRADDFSTLASVVSDRAFTLDDGTTTLVGNNLKYTSHLAMEDASSFIALTFVGTGLDIMGFEDTLIIGDVYIDGVIIGNWARGSTTGAPRVKICSGLPYGTHTIKFDNTVFGGQAGVITDFIIYGPKKPALDDTAIELADYNIMADYDDSSATSTSYGAQRIDGALFKNALREFIYTGTWTIGALNPAREVSGQQTWTSTVSDYVEYTFFGNNLCINFDGFSNPANFTVEINGVLNDTGIALTSNLTNAGSGNYTGAVPDSGQGFLSFRNLGLGVHTIKITYTGGTGSMEFIGFYIGTPIHVNDTKVGSLSLKDKREAVDISEEKTKNKVDLSKAKAWITYDQIDNKILDSYNISAVLDIGTGQSKVYFTRPFKNGNYAAAGITDNANTVHLQSDGDAMEIKNSVQLNVENNATGALSDQEYLSVVFFGALENEEDIDLGDL